MQWGESIRLALDALGVDKVKAFLTMLGVMIGSAAIVLVITIASTGKAYVVGQIEGIGANLAYAALDRNGVPAIPDDELSAGDLFAVRHSLPMVMAAAGTGFMNFWVWYTSPSPRDTELSGKPEWACNR
jgi:putative ABC transport system permease protein